MNSVAESKRVRLLRTLFGKAKQVGISPEELREHIAINITGKRLSECSNRDLARILDHIVALYFGIRKPRFESSRDGLIKEVETLARQRWGEDWQTSLTKLVNRHREVPTSHRFMSIRELKALKGILLRLERA